MMTLHLHGGFRIDDANGVERPIKSKKARALLAFLARPVGKPRSRETITALLWSDRADEQARSSLRQALSGLRRDLGEDLGLALRVTDEAVTLIPEHVLVRERIGNAVFLEDLQVNDPAFDEWLRDERLSEEAVTSDGADITPAEPPSTRSGKPVVMVLPFQSLSTDADKAYFAEGLAFDITTCLSRFRSLTVIGSTTAFQFTDQSQSAMEIAASMGVGYLVHGSLRHAGDRIRLGVQLTESKRGETLWSETLERQLDDVFAVHDEVARYVSSALVSGIETVDRRRARAKRGAEIAAYDLVLLGEQLERTFERDELFRARDLFRQAIERNPESARAHASLARTYLDELWSDWSSNREEAGAMALKFASRAVKLDPDDARARVNMGVALHLVKKDFEAAQIQFAKALELNPNDADAYCLKGWCHVYAGEGDAAIKCTNESKFLSPLDTHECDLAQFFAHYLAGRYQPALESLGRIEEPGHVEAAYRAACLAQLGRTTEAAASLTEYTDAMAESGQIQADDGSDAWRILWSESQPFGDPADLEHLFDGLRRAGLPV